MSGGLRQIAAERTYVDGAFRANIAVVIDDAGIIRSVGAPQANLPTMAMARRALLPGFVNAHSHAFQRGLRGLGEEYPAGQGDFWTWREAMYALVERLSADEFEALCVSAFDEMLDAGITTVGEFHYFHHADPAALDFALDARVLAAAQRTGIRIVLLQSYYRTGGFGQPLAGGQRRFATPAVEPFLTHLESLAKVCDGDLRRIGLAPHSLRAVPPEDLRRLFAAARERGWRVHMHLEEQQREVSDCEAAWGRRPMRWALDELPIDDSFTAIHATHTPAELIRELRERGGRVCLCPLTEGNLGDGFPAAAALAADGAAGVCIGSDSNARIDPFEELRMMEWGQRLHHQRRGVWRDQRGGLAAVLLNCGTRNGAAALGVPTGAIEPGRAADFCTVDLDAACLAGIDSAALPAALVFGASAGVVRDVCVGGKWVRRIGD